MTNIIFVASLEALYLVSLGILFAVWFGVLASTLLLCVRLLTLLFQKITKMNFVNSGATHLAFCIRSRLE